MQSKFAFLTLFAALAVAAPAPEPALESNPDIEARCTANGGKFRG